MNDEISGEGPLLTGELVLPPLITAELVLPPPRPFPPPPVATPQLVPFAAVPTRFGRYDLLKQIGAGGMGEVFLARELAPPGRLCVVKKILTGLSEQHGIVNRFLDEARLTARLAHPNVVQVYEVGTCDDEHFISMEYVAGQTVSRLAQRLAHRHLRVPLGLVLLIGEQVCRGLQHAHERRDDRGRPLGIVHRDLTPSNVCIDYAGAVKVIDFGAAWSTMKAEHTAPRKLVGTLSYMAPEQARRQPLDGRADVYACGVLLWELVCGRRQPRLDDMLARYERTSNPSWAAPSTSGARVPPEVDSLILSALATDPEARPHAGALADALRELRVQHAPSATPARLGVLMSEEFAVQRAVDEAFLDGLPFVSAEQTRRVHYVAPTAPMPDPVPRVAAPPPPLPPLPPPPPPSPPAPREVEVTPVLGDSVERGPSWWALAALFLASVAAGGGLVWIVLR